MTSRRSRGTPWALLIIAGAVGLVIIGGFVVLRMRSQGSSADPGAAAGSASSVAELEALLESPAGSAAASVADPRKNHILSKASLPDAIEVARPMMSNTVGKLDVGSALLAMWASKNLSWQALEALPETTPALFKRDPEAERGRRLCMSGTVLEIRAEKTMANRLVEDKALPLIEQPSTTGFGSESSAGTTYGSAEALASASASGTPAIDPLMLQAMDFAVPDGGKVYFATLQSKPESQPEGTRPVRAVPRSSLFVEVIAVRSSGNLVDGSDARVCGVLTGVTAPPSGLSSPAALDSSAIHRIVGMFDLPQNRAPMGVEVAAQHG
jgi:hypothetical protein